MRMSIFSRLAAALLVTLIFAFTPVAGAEGPAQTLRVGVFQNETKIFYEGGIAKGIFIDLLEAIAAEEHWQITYQPCNFAECLTMLRAGQIDLLPDVALTAERANTLDFHTVAAISSWSQVFGRPGELPTTALDLAGKRLVVLNGSLTAETAQSMLTGFGIDFVLMEVATLPEAFAMVRDGRADAVAANFYYGAANAPKYGLVESTIMFGPNRSFFATGKGRHAEVLEAIDRHLRVWRDQPDSPYAQTLKKWIGAGARAGSPLLWQGIALLGLLLLGALIALAVFRRRIDLAVRDVEAARAHQQAMLDAVPDLLFDIDTEGRYRGFHSPRTDLLAAPREALIGRTIDDVLDADAAATCRLALAEAAATGRASGYEYAVDLPQGRRWFELSVSRKAAVGDEAGFIALARDITDRKRAEDDLRVAAIAFESQEGMFITDAKGIIVRVNRALSFITGHAADAVVGREAGSFDDVRHGEAFQQSRRDELLRTGKWQGEVWHRRADGSVCPDWVTVTAVRDDAGRTTHYVGTLTDNTFRRQAEEEIRQLAFYDALTQLPNRRLMYDRLARVQTHASRYSRQGCLMLLDLDNFKSLNDTLGHDVGDQLLIEVAARLKECVRGGDTVARLGGDEFVVILDDLDAGGMAAAHAEAVATKILQRLAEPYDLAVKRPGGGTAPRRHHGSSSIGLTLFDGLEPPADELLKRADSAMYQAKGAGRGTLQFYDPAMQAAALARTTLEAELRIGADSGQLLLLYQPQFDRGGRITGIEALLRWQHPTRGLLVPQDFLAIADDSGLIHGIGQWVLEAVADQLAAWARDPLLASLTMTINITPRQFAHQEFADGVLAALGRADAPPERLRLDLAEGVLGRDIEGVARRMRFLCEHGIAFALDDFGTGVSSLAGLRRLPLDRLKVDASFVRDALHDDSDALVARAVLALGLALGLEVVAEGVESAAQYEFLAAQGCHVFQGNHLCPPLDAAGLAREIAARASH